MCTYFYVIHEKWNIVTPGRHCKENTFLDLKASFKYVVLDFPFLGLEHVWAVGLIFVGAIC